MAVARLEKLLDVGFTIRQAFARVVHTLNEYRGVRHTYVAFTILHVLPNGDTTILSYDAPRCLWISRYRQVSPVTMRYETLENAVIGEGHCRLTENEGLLAFTDGVTQAGLGTTRPNGWNEDNVAQFSTAAFSTGQLLSALPETVHNQARVYWGKSNGDDITVTLLTCRAGRSVTILTGPPANPADDARTVERFSRANGVKVVCGGTTANIVARQLGQSVQIEEDMDDPVAPPHYAIPGLDMVTEGVVTLNQVANLMDVELDELPPGGVGNFCRLLRQADRVTFLVGEAKNPASEDVSMTQIGVLRRKRIVQLLAGDLEQQGKLVVVEYV